MVGRPKSTKLVPPRTSTQLEIQPPSLLVKKNNNVDYFLHHYFEGYYNLRLCTFQEDYQSEWKKIIKTKTSTYAEVSNTDKECLWQWYDTFHKLAHIFVLKKRGKTAVLKCIQCQKIFQKRNAIDHIAECKKKSYFNDTILNELNHILIEMQYIKKKKKKSNSEKKRETKIWCYQSFYGYDDNGLADEGMYMVEDQSIPLLKCLCCDTYFPFIHEDNEKIKSVHNEVKRICLKRNENQLKKSLGYLICSNKLVYRNLLKIKKVETEKVLHIMINRIYHTKQIHNSEEEFWNDYNYTFEIANLKLYIRYNTHGKYVIKTNDQQSNRFDENADKKDNEQIPSCSDYRPRTSKSSKDVQYNISPLRKVSYKNMDNKSDELSDDDLLDLTIDGTKEIMTLQRRFSYGSSTDDRGVDIQEDHSAVQIPGHFTDDRGVDIQEDHSAEQIAGHFTDDRGVDIQEDHLAEQIPDGRGVDIQENNLVFLQELCDNVDANLNDSQNTYTTGVIMTPVPPPNVDNKEIGGLQTYFEEYSVSTPSYMNLPSIGESFTHDTHNIKVQNTIIATTYPVENSRNVQNMSMSIEKTTVDQPIHLQERLSEDVVHSVVPLNVQDISMPIETVTYPQKNNMVDQQSFTHDTHNIKVQNTIIATTYPVENSRNVQNMSMSIEKTTVDQPTHLQEKLSEDVVH
ncbi:hypothetical protein TCON_2282, partial [Astathelohania contejeani]